MKLTLPDYRYCPFCGSDLDLKTEEGKERKFCRRCAWTYYPRVAASVSAVIIRDTKVLMVQRGRDPFKDTWMFPSGFIDFGEHAIDALVREVREETGLAVLRAMLIGIFQSEDDPRELGHHVFSFLAETGDGEVMTDLEENTNIEWFDWTRPPEVAWKLHQHILAALQKGQLRGDAIGPLSYEFGG